MLIIKNYHTISLRVQTGAALLLLVLILIIGSSYFLATKLNTNLAKTQQHEETGIALSAAKNALIGYAVSYPDKVNPNSGPGYLLCPDKDNDGKAEGSCVLGGTNETIGRLPYKTLELEDLRDGSGERLWYVLSNDYRNFAGLTPLNSDTAGQLTINGVSDIVAIVFAPGEPFDDQDRAADENDVANYLEDDNNNLDVNFVTNAGGDFNDRLIVITRQELMAAVEKRVLGEVKQTLLNYQTSYSAFPWLSTFSDPSASAFRGTFNTWSGHIPYHWSSDPDSIEQGGTVAGRNPFSTSLSVSWNIVDAILSAGTDISDDTMQNSSFNDPVYGVINPVDITNASCEWTNRNSVKCTGTTNLSDPTCSRVSGTCPQTGNVSCDRSYDFDLEFLDESAATVTITDPDAANVRTRDVMIDISLLTSILTNYSIQITDSYTVRGPNPPCIPVTVSETRSLTVDVGTSTGAITIGGLHYDLDVDGMDLNADGAYDDTGEFSPEIPEWFINNNWHLQTLIAYSSSEPLPGGAVACVTAIDCIELNGSGLPDDNKRALAIIAGEALSGQDRTTAPTIEDWFENENKSWPADRIFEKGKTTVNFNDQIKVISTSP